MVEGPESWPYALEVLAPYINSLDIKDFTWESGETGPVLSNVPLGKGMVPFDEYFRLLKSLSIVADVSLHLEYPLGGAENGSKTIDIPEGLFRVQVQTDLDYLKKRLLS
jgi:L-ribulose-5-phosphate 3-epimerase UlaE